ncbi:hypothetical protein C8J57DRAFT_685725 [Mycena rebaudengoi]|nr:hypothetical protein C8J57DRAFT_685725 [Mycena rebaudengoi]
MREALAQNSDVEILRMLQVGRPEMPEALKTLQRALERVGVVTPPPSFAPVSVEHIPPPPPGYTPRSGPAPARSGTGSSSDSSSASSALALAMGHDTLDREFIEGGIDALRRMSKGRTMLPSWTITRYEVERDVKIGIGLFSDVYKGTWRGRTVAIKVLAEVTPRDLFLREVDIWKELKHPNVLELYGASGGRPWFFVCPYERFGSLSTFLRRVAQEGEAAKNGKEDDLPRFMHEVAKGMEYLHEKRVLHGDLKAANVLVDDRIHCLVSDFGQTEMKSEAYRVSGNAPHGTLRWQAPELMLGSSKLTPEMDVYSYAICCIEMLSMGRLPWPLMSDEAVRNFVLKDNTRPKIPSTRFSSSALQELLGFCWDRDPTIRPPFAKIVQEMKQLRQAADHPFGGFDDPSSPVSPRISDWHELDESRTRPSPDMHPVPLPRTPPIPVPSFPFPEPSVSPVASSSKSSHTISQSWPPTGTPRYIHREDTVSSAETDAPELVVYASLSQASSNFTPSTRSSVDDLDDLVLDYGGYESPMPADERFAQIQNERRYRMLLAHDFHPSLTLPLWNPVPVAVGAVGFLDKASGKFHTLFNCFYPVKAANGDSGLTSVYGYGRVSTGNLRQDKRTATQRGIDAITGFLTLKKPRDGQVSRSVSRRYSFPLQSGHKMACLVTESTMYRYVETLEAPKKWFKANVDAILQRYRGVHSILKEDLRLVIGTLDAPNYALFISHRHPDGQVNFNVYAPQKDGQPWGNFTTDAAEQGGPSYYQPAHKAPDFDCKISIAGGRPWDTLLLAVLRFKPDSDDPTSLGGYGSRPPLSLQGFNATDTVMMHDTRAQMTKVSSKTRVGSDVQLSTAHKLGGYGSGPPLSSRGFDTTDTVKHDTTTPMTEVSPKTRVGSSVQPPTGHKLGGYGSGPPLSSRGFDTTDAVKHDTTAQMTEVSSKTQVGSDVQPPTAPKLATADRVVKDTTGPMSEVSLTRVRSESGAQAHSPQESMFVIYTPQVQNSTTSPKRRISRNSAVRVGSSGDYFLGGSPD